MGGHIEEVLRLRVILAEYGESAVVRRAGLGGDPLGHLLLDHNGDGVEAVRLQQGRENGGGDIVGQIGAGHGAQPGEFLPHQGGDILLQHISPEDLQILEFSYSLSQNGL